MCCQFVRCCVFFFPNWPSAGQKRMFLRPKMSRFKNLKIEVIDFFPPSVPLAEPQHELGHINLDRESSIRELRHKATYHSKFGTRIACESIERTRRIKVMRFSPHLRASCSLHGLRISGSMDHYVGLYVFDVCLSL